MPTGAGAAGGDRRVERHAVAWLAMVLAIALHVADETLTGFLAFYNPLVESLRGRWPWLPMPTFTSAVWLAGLAVLVVGLALVGTRLRGGALARGLSWALCVVMTVNGAGHLLGSLYFRRWIPGATTAPLLLAASALLALRTRALTSPGPAPPS